MMDTIWAKVELMGHSVVAGRLSEQTVYGDTLARLDIPQADGSFATQFFGGKAIFRISIVSEETARLLAASLDVKPISPWELPKAIAPAICQPRPADEDGFAIYDDEDDDSDLDSDILPNPPF